MWWVGLRERIQWRERERDRESSRERERVGYRTKECRVGEKVVSSNNGTRNWVVCVGNSEILLIVETSHA